MAPKEPTRHQLSSRLAYSQTTPAFLQKLKNRIAGVPDIDDQYDSEFEDIDDESGRPPIPKRPAIPTRPDDEPGSADEDDGDEKPQVVVLKEGKHLTAREAENVRRKEKGLPPLPDPEAAEDTPGAVSNTTANKEAKDNKPPVTSLSFSSSKSKVKSSANKRKALVNSEDDKLGAPVKKKPKKPIKTLLSFGDDA